MGVDPTKYSWRLVLSTALIGSTAGWALVTTYTLIGLVFMEAQRADWMTEAGGIVVLFAIFGLPVAWLVGLLLGFPICLLAARKGWTSWRAAVAMGATVGLAFSGGSLALRLLDGLDTSESSFGYGGSKGLLWENSWPTALGWWNEIGNIAQIGGIGAIAGLFTWWVTFKRWHCNPTP